MVIQTIHDANVTVNSDAEPEEISDSFLCCICLDLLYKPIVLSCGHISCFWCIHRSMNGSRESRCPICRHKYNYFPNICVLLHRLLLKIYPIAYKRRESQILEEEKRSGRFSPQFDNHASVPLVGDELHHLSDFMHSSRIVCESTSKGESHEKMEHLESASLALNNGTTEEPSIGDVVVMENNLPSTELNSNCKQISIADALCAACKQLLIRPVVLNCGHVYCETCIIIPTEQQLKCEVCQCLNPTGFPTICLDLDQFLEEQFCEEYASRRDAVQLKKVQLKHESGTTCSEGAGKSGVITPSWPTREHSSWLADPRSKVHVGYGCDSCGMFPIIGDRYKCKDCMEASGFDLCGNCYRTLSKLPENCYRTRSKLAGRFNQQHTPEHRMELVKTNSFRDMMMRFVIGRVDVGSPALFPAEDAFEETGSPVTLPNDAQESTSGELTIFITNSENSIDQNNAEPTS